jgi:hypothetical protein
MNGLLKVTSNARKIAEFETKFYDYSFLKC